METDAELWAALVGIGLPLLISAILRRSWNEAQKAWAAFGICLIAAAGTAYFTGNLNIESDKIVRITMIVVLAAWSTYSRFYKPTGITGAIDKLTG